ncbi:MAG: lambda-exonuclease family protein [Rhodanobacter sp.]
MTQLKIAQRSDEWHAWRKGKIGGSDAPSIMDINLYKSAFELYKEKTSPTKEKYVTDHMLKGIELEPVVLSKVEEELGMIFISDDYNCFEMEEHPFLICSLDGRDFDNQVVLEIKCSTKGYDMMANKIVDPMYNCQVQHNMTVTGYYDAILAVCCPIRMQVCFKHIKYDLDYANDLKSREISFYEGMQKGLPPKYIDKDHIPITLTEDKCEIVRNYKSLQGAISTLQQFEKSHKELIESWAEDHNAVFLTENGDKLASVTRVRREGSVDWKRFCQEREIDESQLAAYKKKETGYYRIT